MKPVHQCVLLALCLTALVFVVPHAASRVPVVTQAAGFTPSCALPFESIKMVRPFDKQCPAGGSSELNNGAETHRLQNLAKNNFCAKGAPIAVSFNAFVGLQTVVNNMKDLPWGEASKMPTDRTVLQNLKVKDGMRTLTLGEGTKVVFVGFVFDAKHDDTNGGEDVNCKMSGNEPNDIHIALTPQVLPSPLPKGATDARCNSITAEISPHFRPAAWDKFDAAQFRKILRTNPVRVTGTLLFDAEHRPCTNGKALPGNPVRISVWEIHPVYAIDVCKQTTLARCKVTDNSAWTPFEQLKP